jgi:curli biogenesis system outer membrane secretion channel CsgG
MKPLFPFLLILIFTMSCVPVQVAPTVSMEKKMFLSKVWNVAVFNLNYEYEEEGTISGVRYFSAGKDGGSVIAGLLAADLAGLDNIRIIERDRIAQVLNEQAIQQSGVTDSETAVKLGQLAGADAVIVGELTDYVHWESLTGPGSTISFSIRMIDTESGRIILNSAISRVRGYVEPFANAQLTSKELVEAIQTNNQ